MVAFQRQLTFKTSNVRPGVRSKKFGHLKDLDVQIQGGPPWPSDAISIESNGISNRSNRNSQKFSNDRKIARMARILTIFGRNRSSRRNLSFQKFSNERKIIESIESIDWIGRSIDRSYRSMAALLMQVHNQFIL